MGSNQRTVGDTATPAEPDPVPPRLTQVFPAFYKIRSSDGTEPMTHNRGRFSGPRYPSSLSPSDDKPVMVNDPALSRCWPSAPAESSASAQLEKPSECDCDLGVASTVTRDQGQAFASESQVIVQQRVPRMWSVEAGRAPSRWSTRVVAVCACVFVCVCVCVCV
jgi:hypothetical protein